MQPFFFFTSDIIEYEREQRVRNARAFDDLELARILTRWNAGRIVSHDYRAATILLTTGGSFEIAPNRLSFPEKPTADWYRTAMQHIDEEWGGHASLSLSADLSRQQRLKLRAYAEVFGVQLDDPAECFLPSSLTHAELAQLPGLRAEVRAEHRDAPPERPNEVQELAAMYARRFPFRVPEAA